MWGNIDIITIQTEDDIYISILRALNKVKCSNPILTFLHSNGNILNIGISSDGCYINFIESSNLPPYYSSWNRNDLNQKTESTIEFKLASHTSEIPYKNIIPFNDMLEVAHFFFNKGERSTSIIDWQVD